MIVDRKVDKVYCVDCEFYEYNSGHDCGSWRMCHKEIYNEFTTETLNVSLKSNRNGECKHFMDRIVYNSNWKRFKAKWKKGY